MCVECPACLTDVGVTAAAIYLKHLQKVFTMNDYPPYVVKRCLAKRTDTITDTTEPEPTAEPESTEEKPKFLCLLYVRNLSERIEMSCKDLNVKIVFQSHRTMRTILTSVKNKPAEEKVKGVVYQVDCSCGDTYIGETGRTLEVRLMEHMRAVKTQQSTNGIAVHVKETGHDIQWNNAQVLEQEPMWWKRRY